MIRVVIVGIAGRMGKEIARLVTIQGDLQLVGGVEAPAHSLIGTNVGVGQIVSDLIHLIDESDVVVDFSIPAVVIRNALQCVDHGKPFITGVTGWQSTQMQQLFNAARKIPVVYAPNFSVGVGVIKKICVEMVRLLGADYDIHLIETHHKAKRDAPSGTAQLLSTAMQEQIGKRNIQVISIRTGEVVGEHKIIFGGPGERIELVHKAENRGAFAAGVIRAVRWIVSQPPGLYSMSEVLGI